MPPIKPLKHLFFSLFFLFLHTFCLTSSVSAESAILAWSENNEPDLAGYRIHYGTASRNYGPPVDVGKQTSRTLTGLTAGATYYFSLTAYDSSLNESPFSAEVTKTISAPDLVAPALTNILASSITQSSAVITWLTNEEATSRVEYGLTTSYGTPSSTNNTLVVSHSRTLTGLASNTTYHYRVISTDASGNTATSGSLSFKTNAEPDTTPPVLSAVAVAQFTDSTAIITWTTNEAATSLVEYGTNATYGTTSSLNNMLVTGHSRTLINLSPNQIYHYRVISTDAAGNTSRSVNTTFRTAPAPDTRPPNLSGISSNNLSGNSTQISWGTDEPATGQVEYGETSAYGNLSPLNQTLSTGHQFILTALQPGIQYHYRVISTDGSGNTTASDNTTFTSMPHTAEEALRAFASDQQIVLEWVNPSDSGFVGVRIRFRTDRFPDERSDDGSPVGDFAGKPGEKGTFIHEDLKNGETYYYIAESYDKQGNQKAVRVSATPVGEESAGGGGCGMVFPTDGHSQGPGDTADMMTLLGILLLLLLKKAVKTCSSRGLSSI